MTANDSEYSRGAMDIEDQRSTFDGFMRVTVWSSLLTAALVFYFTLVFAVGVPAFGSLGAAVVLGVAGGVAVRMGSAYYMTIGGLAVFGLLGTLFAMGVGALLG